MKDIIQLTGNVYELAYLVMIELKFLQPEKVFNIFQITCDQVIHTNDMEPFLDEPVTKMRPQESGCAGDQYAFPRHDIYLIAVVPLPTLS